MGWREDVEHRLDQIAQQAAAAVAQGAETRADVEHAVRQGGDTQAVVIDTRTAVAATLEELAHLRGAVAEGREAQAHLAGAVGELRRRLEETAARAEERGREAPQGPLRTLEELLARVEPYQPVYGLSVGSQTTSRDCADRATAIHAALGSVDGLRILDLGTSLGYFPFYFADRGALTEGWDFKGDNIAVCRTAAAVTGSTATFHERLVDLEGITALAPGQFDVALCLSILHHVTAEHGLAYTQELVTELMARVPTVVVELARKGEDPSLYWDAAQPEDPMEIFATVEGEIEVVPVGDFGTHLSATTRPLLVVRRTERTVRVGGTTVRYDSVVTEPYENAPIGAARQSRRYFHSAAVVVKEYTFTPERPENWRQIMSELYFFTAVLPLETVHHAPRLLDYDVDRGSARLAFERTPGGLLDELAPMTAEAVTVVARDLLTTLRDLHAIGLHHNDVRSWNVVVDDDGSAWLIDYGLCGPVGYTDDLAGLLGALRAALTGRREAAGSTVAPEDFPDGPLRSIAADVLAGTRDPSRLLEHLT